jgi:DNA repair protein SbcD/Mre11
MRILHTGDWHLGDRIGRRGIDRTEDLQRAVERIMKIVLDNSVETMLIAGDLFSDKLHRQEDLADILEHLGRAVRPFLLNGGTILAVTGNHDKEQACLTLKNSLALADPNEYPAGSLIRPGRFYLATGPTFYRLTDRTGTEVQFVMMPYPMPSRYLSGAGTGTREELNRQLLAAYMTKLQQILDDRTRFRADLPTVLVAHIYVGGALIRQRFRLDESHDVSFRDGDIPAGFAYVALGHVHQPQLIGKEEHIRYCGSIERLDKGEKDDAKSVCIFDVAAKGREGPVQTIPLEATPFYDIVIADPESQVPGLAEDYPEHERALVYYTLHWKAGVHNSDQLLKKIEKTFPNCYDRDVVEEGRSEEATQHQSLPGDTSDPRQVVLHFLEDTLTRNGVADRDEILALARVLLDEKPAGRGRQKSEASA